MLLVEFAGCVAFVIFNPLRQSNTEGNYCFALRSGHSGHFGHSGGHFCLISQSLLTLGH